MFVSVLGYLQEEQEDLEGEKGRKEEDVIF